MRVGVVLFGFFDRRTCSVFVELIFQAGGGSLLYLTFNDEGLVTRADVFKKAES